MALEFGEPSPLTTPTHTTTHHHAHLGVAGINHPHGFAQATPFGNATTGAGSAVIDYDQDPALFTHGSIGSSSLGGFSIATTPMTPPSVTQSWHGPESRILPSHRSAGIPTVPLGMLATTNIQPGDDITKSPWYKIAAERANRMLSERLKTPGNSSTTRNHANNNGDNAVQNSQDQPAHETADIQQLPRLPGAAGIRSGQIPGSCHSSPGPVYSSRERSYPFSGLPFSQQQQPSMLTTVPGADGLAVAMATSTAGAARTGTELQPGSPGSSIASDFSVPDSASQLGHYNTGNAYHYTGSYGYNHRGSVDMSSVRSSLNSVFSGDGAASQSGQMHGNATGHLPRHASRKVSIT